MERLEVSGEKLRLPPLCACCLALPETTVRAEKRRSTWLVVVTVHRVRSLAVPYCHTCARHVVANADGRISLITILIGFGTFAGLVPVLLAAGVAVVGLAEGHWMGSALLALLAATAFIVPVGLAAAYHARATARRDLRGPAPHARAGPAVEILDFSSSGVRLGVHDDAYAELVLALNHPEAGNELSPAARDALHRLAEAVPPRAERAEPPPAPEGAMTSAPAAPATPTKPPEPWRDDATRRHLELTRDAPSAPSVGAARALSRSAAVAAGRAPTPETLLRFAAFRCELRPDGLRASYRDGSHRQVSWSQVSELFVRQLPPDPPWERALLIDVVAGPYESEPPIRILSGTFVNFIALPGGAGTSRADNLRRLALHVLDRQPSLRMDPETEAFVRRSAPAPAFRGMRQFSAYDERYPGGGP